MTISAKVIADSSAFGKRITTMELRYPRFIHAEELTHRVLASTPGDCIIIEQIADGLMYDENLSRNASSSRAIPVERMIQDVLDDPAMPIYWGKNQPGMQAREEHDAPIRNPWHHNPNVLKGTMLRPEEAWLRGRDQMIELARAYAKAGYHKQIVNRLLETWLHINVVVTATEWDNFRTLRLHKDAQPEIHELARLMFEVAMAGSTPRELQPGEWHLPYVEQEDFRRYHISDLKALSVARCASVSYKTVDGQPMTLERAQAIYDKLVKADVFHASPFEHQATPDTFNRAFYDQWGEHDGWNWQKPELHGNFVGWIQNRKLMEKQL
ncbi:FAD-dependent thymidylate synthase [Mesorhizobium sp. WSM2239]|uniref:FAD-dependent thymidylate synthase n=2 Tax=unclassified Mesorhizobium TaxID=325217 RepID=A0AAU8D0F7_9HYPH